MPMLKHDVHFCLVSGQPLPNLLPVMSAATQPSEVLMLVSPDMRDKAALLRSNLENLGCRVDAVDIHPYRLDAICATILELLERYQGRQVALNATCGTKIMALGAYEVFRQRGLPVFYVDTDNRQQITLLPVPACTPLPDLVTVKMSLAAYGYRINQTGTCQISPRHQHLGDYLVKQVARLSGALGILNACAASARPSLQAQLYNHQRQNPALAELLEQFERADLLVFDGHRLIFRDEKARFFANGGWLEDHVIKVVNRIKGQKLIRDHQSNLQLLSEGGLKNEIDLAFTANNRLHLIECKTALMVDKKDKEGRADGVAYKLEALRDLIGETYARAMLVSYRQLTPEDRRRCREYRIEVVEGAGIQGLYGRLQRWIGPK